MTPQDALKAGLAAASMLTLRAYFDAAGHYPSPCHWHALRAIADTMEAMTNGTCPAKVFLSAVDPGVGKSQTVAHFARALLASEEHRGVGMIVCVGRVKEAEDFAAQLGQQQHVGVLTKEVKVSPLGCELPQGAQVLITGIM